MHDDRKRSFGSAFGTTNMGKQFMKKKITLWGRISPVAVLNPADN